MRIYTRALAVVLSVASFVQVSANSPGSSISGAQYNRLYDGGDRRFYGDSRRINDPRSYSSQREGPGAQEVGYFDPTRQEVKDESGQVQDDELVSPLPEGWAEYVDPSSGRSYYYNSFDGKTTWDRPLMSQQKVMVRDQSKNYPDAPERLGDEIQVYQDEQVEYQKNEPWNETEKYSDWKQSGEGKEEVASSKIEEKEQWDESKDVEPLQPELVTNAGPPTKESLPSQHEHDGSTSQGDDLGQKSGDELFQKRENEMERPYGAYQEAPIRTGDVVPHDGYHNHSEEMPLWNQQKPPSHVDTPKSWNLHQQQQQQSPPGRNLQDEGNMRQMVDRQTMSQEPVEHREIHSPPQKQYTDQRNIEMKPYSNDVMGRRTFLEPQNMAHRQHLEHKSAMQQDVEKEYSSGDPQWDRQQQPPGNLSEVPYPPRTESKDQSSWGIRQPTKESSDKLEYSEQPRYFSQEQEQMKSHDLASRIDEDKRLVDAPKKSFTPTELQQQHYPQQQHQQQRYHHQHEQQQQQWRRDPSYQQHYSDHRQPPVAKSYHPSGTMPFVPPQKATFHKEIHEQPKAPANEMKHEEENKPGILSSWFGKKAGTEEQKVSDEGALRHSIQQPSPSAGTLRPFYGDGPVQNSKGPPIVDRSATRPLSQEEYSLQRSQQPLPQHSPHMYGAPRPYHGQYSQSNMQQHSYPHPPLPSQQDTGGQLQPYNAQQGEPGGSLKSMLGNAWQGVLGFSEKAKSAANQYKDIAIQEASKVTETVSSQSAGILGRVRSQAESIQKSLFEGEKKPMQDEYSMSPYGNVQSSGPKQHQPPPSGNYPPQNYGGYPRDFVPPVPRGIQAYPHQQGVTKQPNQYPSGNWQGYPENRPPMQSQYGQAQHHYPQRYQGPEQRVPIQGQATRQNPISPQGPRSNSPGWNQQAQVPNQQRNPDRQSRGNSQSDPWSHPGLDGF
jgi:hypothetical protein